MGIIDANLEAHVKAHTPTAIDRFTAGLTAWDQLIEECIESERDEEMTERDRTAKLDELDTIIASLQEELGLSHLFRWGDEGIRFRRTTLIRLTAQRHLVALAS